MANVIFTEDLGQTFETENNKVELKISTEGNVSLERTPSGLKASVEILHSLGSFKVVDTNDGEDFYFDTEYVNLEDPVTKDIYSMTKYVRKKRAEPVENDIHITTNLVNTDVPKYTTLAVYASAESYAEEKYFDLSSEGEIKGIKGFNALPEEKRTITFTSPDTFLQIEGKPKAKSVTKSFVIPEQVYSLNIVEVHRVTAPVNAQDVIHIVTDLAAYNGGIDGSKIEAKLNFIKVDDSQETALPEKDIVGVYNYAANAFLVNVEQNPHLYDGLETGNYKVHVHIDTSYAHEDYNYSTLVQTFDLTSEVQAFTK